MKIGSGAGSSAPRDRTGVRVVARSVRRWWMLHPQAGLAIRTAIAGGLAWLVAQLLPGWEAGRYAYFAPMGAVVVTSTSVVGTLRGLRQSVTALAAGAGLGLLALTVTSPHAWSLALVIALSVLVAGWLRLGVMKSWVPTVAIFTLILGQGQSWTYAAAYVGLSALGAAIGVAVVVLIPQLVVEPLDDAARRLWQLIFDRLKQLRDDLDRGNVLDPSGSGDLDAAIQLVTDCLEGAEDGSKINRRSRRGGLAERLARGRTVRTVAQRLRRFQLRLVEHESDGRAMAGEELGHRLAEAIDLILDALRDSDADDLEADLDRVLADVDEAVHNLPDGSPGLHTASSSAYELRQLALEVRSAVRDEEVVE